MPFDWNDYFTLAAELANKKDEARLRSAISRSYYCVYNLAKAYLQSNSRTVRGADHEALWNQFTSIEGKISVQSWGDRARKIRNKADYDDTIKNLEIEFRVAMMNAQYIINELKKPISIPPES